MRNYLRLLVGFVLLLSFASCVDAVEPRFQYETGFLLVEGRITDVNEYNEIQVARSEFRFGRYVLDPVAGARVTVVDQAGNETAWAQEGMSSQYRPPADWAATVGDTYFVRVVTPEGELVESEPSIVPEPVPISNLRVDFQQEAYFSDARERFIPAFRLLVDLDDPAGERNYYQYRFRAFQQLRVCARCYQSRWRNGECIASADTRSVERWDYVCDRPCWSFDDGDGIYFFNDEFADGRRITGLEAGRYDYDFPGGLLFNLQQYSINQAAYDYNVVLRDLTENSGGLNAPLPAALVGNL
ncbi:MAG: DUF4249 domain-containing protein, partial [Bacteroidota bacterium]